MINRIIILYKSGKSISEISKIIGISRNKCYKLAHKANLQLDGRQFRCNDSFFSTYTSESCYWAGFLAADGCVYKNLIKISLSYTDYDHLCLFKKMLDFTGPVKRSCRKNKFYSTISITSRQMICDLFDKFNITSRKSLVLRPPKNIPGDLVNHYIRGYIDGDGCININSTGKSVSMIGSKHIIKWIKYILKSRLLVGNPQIRRIGNVYCIQFNGNRQFNRIINFIYKDSMDSTRLYRKYILTNYRSPQNILKEQKEKKVIELYKNGKSINFILKNTEFGYFRIYRILSNADIKINRTNKKQIPENIKNNIIELRKRGERVKDISRITGISNPKISEFLREYQNGI